MYLRFTNYDLRFLKVQISRFNIKETLLYEHIRIEEIVNRKSHIVNI